MYLEILITILLIFIVLLFILILKPVHIYLLFKNKNLSCDGVLYISHYLLELELLFNKKILLIKLKINQRKFILKEINLDKKVTNKFSDNNQEDNKFNIQTFKELLSLMNDSFSEILEIVYLLTKICKFKKSFVVVNLGLKDNNLTIKTCNFIWAITAPFYPLGVEVILIPEINKYLIKSDIEISCDIVIINILKVLLKILKSKNLRSILFKIIK